MQVQKEEMREDIVAAAEYEFLLHGYNGASIRTIAKRANTTIGNVYNYFKNKEALLDAIVGEIPKQIIDGLHKPYEAVCNQVEQGIVRVDPMLSYELQYDLLLSNASIILLEGCEGTKYENFNDEIRKALYKRILEYLGKSSRSSKKISADVQLYINTIVATILHAVIYVAKTKTSQEEGVKVLLKYMKMIIDRKSVV